MKDHEPLDFVVVVVGRCFPSSTSLLPLQDGAVNPGLLVG